MPCLLVVEDCAHERHLIEQVLRAESESSWDMVFAEDGKSALQKLREQAFDLIISDIQLPTMDGFELLTQVRQRHPRTPLMLVTKNGSEEIAMRALSGGAAGYIPEEFVQAELIPAVRRILDANEAHARRERLLECMECSESRFSLDNDRELIPTVLTRLQHSLRLFEICDESERLRVRMALDEAINNALYHGNLEVSSDIKEHDFEEFYRLADQRRHVEPYSRRRIWITERMTRDEAIFIIRDDGAGFDVSRLPDPTNPENLFKASGRGIMMMHAFMDQVTFNDLGNEVCLIKRRVAALPASEDVRRDASRLLLQ